MAGEIKGGTCILPTPCGQENKKIIKFNLLPIYPQQMKGVVLGDLC